MKIQNGGITSKIFKIWGTIYVNMIYGIFYGYKTIMFNGLKELMYTSLTNITRIMDVNIIANIIKNKIILYETYMNTSLLFYCFDNSVKEENNYYNINTKLDKKQIHCNYHNYINNNYYNYRPHTNLNGIITM
jgi:hypothetical protein